MDFNNKVGVLEFVDLSLDDFTMLCSMIALLLDNQFHGFIQVETVVDYEMINYRLVFRKPSKHILVCLQ